MTSRLGISALLAPFAGALLMVSAAAQLAPIEIAPGETVTGALDAKDFQFNDGSFYECYAITGAPGTSIMLTMRSTAFDTLLLAVSSGLSLCRDLPGDDAPEADDDGGGGPNGTDSQLTLTFDANGRFLIAANSFQAGGTGEYTLTVETVAGGATVPPKGPGAPAAPPAAVK